MASSATTKSSQGSGGFKGRARRLSDSIAKNSSLAVGGLIVALISGAALALFASHKDEKSAQARNALYLARKNLETELKTVAAKGEGAAPAKPVKQDPSRKTAASAEQIEYQKIDVDHDLPKSVELLKKVSDAFGGTRAGFEADLVLGNLYFNHGHPEKSVAWYEKAVSHAPNSLDRAMGLSSLGYAYEETGDLKAALDKFEQAVGSGEAVKADVLLAVGRCHARLHDAKAARDAYQQVMLQYPNSTYSRQAETLTAQLE